MSSNTYCGWNIDDVTLRGTPTDVTPPTVSSLIPTPATVADANVGVATFAMTVTFNEAMNTAVAPAISFPVENPGGTLTFDGSVSGWSNNTTYVARYDVADLNVTLQNVDVRVTGAKDVAGNTQNQADFAAVFSIDTLNPTVTIDQAVGQADPSITSPINFTAVFSEPVFDFTSGGVTLSGTAGATTVVVTNPTGDDLTYNVAVSGMTGNGTVIATVAAGVAHDGANNPNTASASTDNTVTYSLAQVVGRHIFYNNSTWDADPANPSGDPAANAYDNNAIAPENSSDPHLSKTALLPGQTATFNNYTSYSLGINGIMVDFDYLPGTVTAADFEFKMGNTTTPDTWDPAPAPLSVTVRQVNGVDRVTIIWADNAIQNTWLQVTVKATANTGLAQNDVFYYGNAVGESGNSATDTLVNSADDVAARLNPSTPFNPAAIDNPYDYNRDRLVNSADQVIPRYNATTPWTMLELITAPAVVATDDAAATDKATAVSIAVLSNDSNASGALSVSQVDAASSLGASLAINADQTIRYDPSVSTTLQALTAGQSLWDTCTYTIQDSKGPADRATVNVLVSGMNEAPGAGTGAQRGSQSEHNIGFLSGGGHSADSRGCHGRI